MADSSKFALTLGFVVSCLFGSLTLANQTSESVAAVAAAPTLNCGTETSDGLTFRYCIEESDPAQNPDILYFMHPVGGSEQSWFTSTAREKLHEEWAKKNIRPPTIISISLGPSWLLTEQGQGNVKDVHALFVNVLMTKLESLLTTKQKARTGQRLLLGQSMGGFNAAMLLLKNGGLFTRVALICPALGTVNPHAPSEQVSSYVKRTGAKESYVQQALQIGRREFATVQAWTDHDPLKLAQRRLNKASPKLYISIGTRDEYGFYEGTKRFAEIAQEKGVKTEFHPMNEGHCALNPPSLADFLKPAASDTPGETKTHIKSESKSHSTDSERSSSSRRKSLQKNAS